MRKQSIELKDIHPRPLTPFSDADSPPETHTGPPSSFHPVSFPPASSLDPSFRPSPSPTRYTPRNPPAFSLSPFQEDIRIPRHRESTSHSQHAEYLQRQAFLQIQSHTVTFPIISESISRRPMILANLVVAPIMSVLIFILAYSVDHFESNEVSVINFFRAFVESDPGKMLASIGASLRALANIFSLVITFSALVIQLASNRYSAQAILLLFADWWMIAPIAFFLFTLLFHTFVIFSIGEIYVGHVSYIFCLFLTIICLLIVFPYFYYLFDWLDPVKIVKRIQRNVHEVTEARAVREEKIIQNQIKAVRGIDHLSDIAKIEALKNGRTLAFSVLDSLLSYCLYYLEKKHRKHPNWFIIPASIRSTPDFEFLPPEIIEYYEHNKIWMEAKILRQFYSIFNDSLQSGRLDMVFLAVSNTRKLAEAACKRKDVALLILCITFFNTFLRFSIRAKSAKVVSHIMHLYRQLAEILLAQNYASKQTSNDANDEFNTDFVQRLISDIQDMHWTYYYNLALGAGDLPIASLIAHDQATLVEVAFYLEVDMHEQLLEAFLVPRWCENSSQVEHLPVPNGVLKAKIKLATTYICADKTHFARKIHEHLKDIPRAQLITVWKDLVSIKAPSFWEINDRGYNLDYLNPDQKEALERFMGWFTGLSRPTVVGDDRASHPMLLWSPAVERSS